ncbi:hypothetical protein IJ579_06005 [bacterium]|nr:hypothetical protein [bacterium]
MNKIGFNKIGNLKLNKGVSEINSMNVKELLENITRKISLRAEREVPEYGEFKAVEESIVNTDKTLEATDLRLKIVKAPKGAENHEILRDVYLIVSNRPTGYEAQRIVAFGTKDEILKKLASGEFLSDAAKSVAELAEKLKGL